MKRLRIVIALSLILVVSGLSHGASEDITDVTEPVVLVTGFEPFGQHEINPSQVIAENLDGKDIDGATIVGIVLPIDYEKSFALVTQAIENLSPVLVINIGLYARVRSIHVEKLGINLYRDPFDDENGSIFHRINLCGSFYQVSSLPTRRIAQEIRRAGIPARQSVFAGTYLCNALMYRVLSIVHENEEIDMAGFIHVPPLPSQDPQGMELDTLVEAIEITIQVSLR